MLQRISIGEARLLPGMHPNRRPLASGFAFAFPHRHQSRVSVGIDVEAVVAGFGHGECLIRSVNLPDFAAVKFAQMYVQSALMQLDLHRVIGDVGQGQAAFGTDTHYTRAQIQLGARIFVGPDVVPYRERTVQ
jgi:hypothetical protein